MSTFKFVGREKELSLLRESSNQAGPQLTALYGRRRVGKTRLVKEACKDKKVYRFEGLEGINSSGQKAHFLKQLSSSSNIKNLNLISPRTDWTDLLVLLAEHVKGNPCVIFFDEFQWMAAGRNELVSKLKYVWDNYFIAGSRVHMILCGSVSSFLVKKVIRSKALFGRIDNIIHLQPLPFPTVKKGFFSKRSVFEALEYYLIAGGIPKYLELYDSSRSIRLNLQKLCFRPGAYFLEELNRIFTSHFGDAPQYRRIIEFLASRSFSTRKEIGRHLRLTTGGRLSEYLENLEMAGFIESYVPLHSASSSFLMRFRIIDPYLRFYFNFIKPVKRRIKMDMDEIPFHQAVPDKRYAIYLGLAFERFCYQHGSHIARLLGFSAVAYTYGAFYRKKDMATNLQIDLLFRRSDKVITLCEIKFKQETGKEVIREMERKVRIISSWDKNSTIEPVLISVYAPGESVYKEGCFSSILTAEDFA
ncbi:ATP-binding protein [Fibrobacterota bacterium]